jgi:hypothetical protein
VNLQVVFLNDRCGPHAPDDLVLRHQCAFGPNQQFENIECAAADTHPFAVQTNFAALEKDVELPDLNHCKLSFDK